MGSWELICGELREARIHAGLSQEDLAKRINYSASHVSGVETGQRAPRPDYLAAVDNALTTGGLFVRLAKGLSHLESAPPWLREWVDNEREADQLRWYEPAFVPGILQTEAYARALLTLSLLPSEELEQRVSSRLSRQAVITKEQPVQLVAVIDAMVLRRPLDGHPGVMAEQLTHLTKMAELPHVQILVVPEDTGIYPGLQGGFILATLPDQSVVAYLDHQVSAHVVSQPAALATLQRTWEAVRGEALSRRQSLNLIKKAVETWT